MSFTDEYLKALEEEKKKRKDRGKNQLTVTPNRIQTNQSEQTLTGSDIAPVQEKRTWLQAGALDDGYDFGDVTKTILGTTRDVAQNFVEGVVGIAEPAVDAVFDAGSNLFNSFGNLVFGKENMGRMGAISRAKSGKPVFGTGNGDSPLQQTAHEIIAEDAIDEEAVAEFVIGPDVFELIGENAEDSSVLGEKSDSLVQSAGQLAVSAGLQGVGVPWQVTMGASSYGSELENAYNNGASTEEAHFSAAVSAGAEILTGSLFKIPGIAATGSGKVGQGIVGKLTKNISSTAVKNLFNYGVNIAGEGFEEVGTSFFQRLGQSLSYEREDTLEELAENEEARNSYVNQVIDKLFGEEAREEYGEAFVGGFALAGLGGAPSTISATKAGRDINTGLSANEQRVLDKVAEEKIREREKDGKKLTTKEKISLEEEIRRDMEKGYISTDTIEEVLGGETYKTYKDTVDSEDALHKEFEELGKKENPTLADQARYAELSRQIKELQNTSKRDQLKSQLGNEVFDMVKGTTLAESYNERARRRESFQADISQYDVKQQAVIQKAIDSGVLNNTRRTHEFVELVAKISADKGVLFDFADNAKLKDSGFALDGKTVNGYVTKDGVTVNIDSAKSLNSVVGHEITHVLEGTELYDALKQTLFDYAKSKGDFQGRYDALTELYKDVKDADVEAELAADLVGDYLFTDADFINNLSAKHRNVFQKIYDEIKYLCKIATAGSKEARALESVKRAFEKAYREGSEAQKNTADGGVKYKLSDIEIDRIYIDYADTTSANTAVDNKVSDLVERGKVVRLSDDSVANYENSVDWTDYKAVRTLLEGILEPNLGVSVVLKHGEQGATAYLTRNGINHSVGGPASPNKAVAFEMFSDLVKNSEYAYSSENHQHSNNNKKIDGEIIWDTFVAVGSINGKPYPVTFKIRSIDADIRSQIYEMATKNETGFSHGVGNQENLTNEHPNYGTSPISGDNVPQKGQVVKTKASLSNSDSGQLPEGQQDVTDAQNEQGLDRKGEVSFSLSNDAAYMDSAIEKNNAMLHVDTKIMEDAKAVRSRIAERMNAIKDRGLVGLPEDIEGNTYIANSSYDGTEENTTICPRSLASEAFVDAVSEYLGRPLSVEEQIYISQDLQGRSLTPECTYCYVATDRKAYRAFLGEYINQRDAVIEKVQADSDADVSRSGELYKEFLNGRKDTKPMYIRFKMWVDACKNGTPMVEASHLANINKLMGDINSEFGEALKPQIVDAMKYAQSASWAKKRVNYVAYNGHILKWKQDRINKLNSHYGLRMYSFSDFHPAFVLENMQMITDASVRGLKMLGYTKDTDFVEIFAPSGMNINVSTFGFETDGNVYENNIIGAEWEKAKALREQYPNVGITFVATNDTLVEWALEQDWIDVVIPYHLVRTGAEVAKAFNYTNYTSESSDTKTKDWAKGNAKYIAPTEHNNDLETYLAALRKNNLDPRFKRFLDNPKTRNNYMKLVNECRQSASESKPVQPVFNEDAAMVALAKLEANGYYQPIGGSVDRMYEIAAEVAENMAQELAPVMSLSGDGEQHKQYGNYNVSGKDLKLDTAPVVEDIAPVQATVSETETVAPVTTPTVDTATAPETESGSNAQPQSRYEQFSRRQAELTEILKDKDAFFSNRATELYNELRNLKKGVRASKELGYLLDTGHEWGAIRAALVNIKHTPSERVNMNSAIESIAREMINEEYEDLQYELDELNAHPVNENTAPQPITTVQERVDQKIRNAQAELEKNRRYREEAYQTYADQISKAEAELAGKKNKHSKVAEDIKRRIERLKRQQGDIDATYEKRISDLESRVEKYTSEDYSRAEYRRDVQEKMTRFWADTIGDTATWKDLPLGLAYKTKTLRRILRAVVRDVNGNRNIDLADTIYDELETKYDHHEAQLKVESGKLKQVFADLKLTSAEDTYAQMLGEFRHNPETTLTQEVLDEFYQKHKNKIDTAKVDRAIEESRKLYDDLIVRVNEVLKKQGMREIPYRQGYFPHFTNPKQNWLMKALNWKPVDNEIPTSIAGLTQDFKPQRSWQTFAQKRRGDTTDYSLYKGLDTYIHGALDWIYHIEDIQSRRSLENYIRFIHSDEGIQQRIKDIQADDTLDAFEVQDRIDAVLAEAQNPLGGLVRELMNRTNTLANKKSSMDREMEDMVNRKVYSTMTNLNNRINANMVVGSFSSALTNFIPMVQSWHQVSPVYTVQGLRDMVRSTIHDDGTVAKSDFLTNRLVNEENLYKTGWDKVSDKAAAMMNVIDNITSQTVWRSKYLQNIHEGMSESQAIKDADQFAKNLIAGRSRGNMPSIFDAKNPLTKIFTAFQLEVANQYGYMFEDAPQDSTSKTRLVKGYATAFMGAYLYNALYSSLVGRDAAFDPIGIIEDLLKDLFDDEEEPEDVLLNFGENIVQEVPFVGGLLGGGRVPISSALPYSDYSTPFESMLSDVTEGNWDSFGKEFLKPLYYLAMPVGGGQIKKTVEGLSMFSDEHPVSGSYTKNGDLRFTVEDTLGNRIQAGMFGQYASKNARDYFDNERSPLDEKRIQEYVDVDVPIGEYWAYREGLKGLETLAEKADYINSLDLPTWKKNLLINNLADRKEDIDMTSYDEYADFEEFDYAQKNPEKYEFLTSEMGVAYHQYKDADEDTKSAYNWAFKNQGKYTVSKAISDDYLTYYQHKRDMSDMAKDEVIEYINGLDIDYGQKIILFRSKYDSKADKAAYNADIIDYLNSRDDISYEEMEAILKELGFDVSSDGTVTWD